MKTSASEPKALTPARHAIATIIARYATEDAFSLDQAVSDMLDLFSYQAAATGSQRTAVGWIAADGLKQLQSGRVTTIYSEQDHLAHPIGLHIGGLSCASEPKA